MIAYVVRRLLVAVPLLFAVVLACFVLMHALPGDPVTARLGPKHTPEAAARLRAELGLDQPMHVQFGRYMGDMARLDFGRDNGSRPINEQLATHVPATIELALAAIILASIVGVSAGVLAAGRAGRTRDAVVMTASLAGVSIPIFWLGMLAQRLFREGGVIDRATGWGGLDVSGRVSVDTAAKLTNLENLAKFGGADAAQPTGFYLIDAAFIYRDWAMLADVLSHLALPAIVLATVPTAMIARITRAAVGAELGEDYVRTARAKGVLRHRIVRRHVLRNAAIAIVTTIGTQLGYLLGGAVLTETIFDWPGLGKYAVEAINRQEHRQLMAAVLVVAVGFVAINLLVDLSYGLLDPRVRVGGGKA